MSAAAFVNPDATPVVNARPTPGRLAVQVVDGASSVITAEASNPLKFLVSTPRGQCAWVYTTTYGGGLVAGDQVVMDIEVAAGASLYLGTQASTKVYRSDGAVAQQTVTARVAAAALLVALPDPVAPFAESRFHQRQIIDCAPTADLVWLDGVTCGRAARDERWAFTSYVSSLVVRVDGHPIVRDSLRLTDGLRPVRERLPEVGALATAVIGGPGMQTLCAKILARVAAQPLEVQPRLSASSLGNSPLGTWGIVLRAAAVERETLERTVHDLLTDLCPRLGDDPWQRRP